MIDFIHSQMAMEVWAIISVISFCMGYATNGFLSAILMYMSYHK